MTSEAITETRFILGDHQVRDLAKQFGTPLYVINEAHLRAKARSYREAAAKLWPKTSVSYASKANSTLAVIRAVWEEGFTIDAASEGELRAALLAGVPANQCDLHGNNKTRDEIAFAVKAGVRHIVVDCFEEIEKLREFIGSLPGLVIRLAPGVDPKTHSKISTGQADTKFGFNIADGSGERALVRMLELGMPVKGFHCHVGSQLLDPEAQISGGETLAEFAVAMKERHGYELEELNVGGGLGIHYVGTDRPLKVEEYNRLLIEAVAKPLLAAGLNPVIHQEPGRSIIGESGVTIYEVGVVKTVPSLEKGLRTYVAVDGGLSDNPRPALYGSKYTVLSYPLSSRPDVEKTQFTVSGKHCETDTLFSDVELRSDLQAGDYLQVLCTGAYNSTMANQYNRYPRPATAWIKEDGDTVLVQRRDRYDEMFARESLP